MTLPAVAVVVVVVEEVVEEASGEGGDSEAVEKTDACPLVDTLEVGIRDRACGTIGCELLS
jgi:hypothetical protein